MSRCLLVYHLSLQTSYLLIYFIIMLKYMYEQGSLILQTSDMQNYAVTILRVPNLMHVSLVPCQQSHQIVSCTPK